MLPISTHDERGDGCARHDPAGSAQAARTFPTLWAGR